MDHQPYDTKSSMAILSAPAPRGFLPARSPRPEARGQKQFAKSGFWPRASGFVRNRSKVIEKAKWMALRSIALSVFFFLIVPWHARAQAPSVHLALDRNVVSLNETFTLSIEIEGGNALTEPDLPHLDNFELIGRHHGTSIKMVNGSMSLTKAIHLTLAPLRPGKFSIGPIKVPIDGRVYTAGPVRVTVTGTGGSPRDIPSQPRNPFAGSPAFPGHSPFTQTPLTPPSHPPEEKPASVFVTTEVDQKEIYVGEQIVFTFRFYRSVNVQEAQLKLPNFKDFLTEELVKERRYEVNLKGRRYAVNEWRFVLFPTKAGEIKTGVASVTGQVAVSQRRSVFDDPFFQRFSPKRLQRQTFRSKDIALKVKELPPAPEGFTGLVGQFSLASHLSQDTMSLGETTELEIEISGRGNISDARLPKLKAMEAFKVYPSKPSLKLHKTLQGLRGKKVFKYALVADRPGKVTTPAFELYYFDPNLKQYQSLVTPAYTVAIQGQGQGERLVTAGIDPPSGAHDSENKTLDLHPIPTTAAMLAHDSFLKGSPFFWWALLVASPGSWICYGFFKKWRASSPTQKEDKKRSQAFKRAKRALGGLKLKDQADFEAASEALRQFLSDRFQVAGAALTPKDVEALLADHQVSLSSIQSIVNFLEQMDGWRYGGTSQVGPESRSLIQEVLPALREIEAARSQSLRKHPK